MMNFLEKLRAAAGDASVKEQESMSGHTTFRVGGPARYFVSPSGERELAAVVRLCREEAVDFYILGNGSNLLISDRGYDGVMIQMSSGFSGFARETGRPGCYRAGAGLLLSRIARNVLEDGFSGFEFAAGIPGTLGGAVVMNAGAYGGEMKDILTCVRVMTPEGEILELPAGELELGYRHSCIPEKGYIVLEAEFCLETGDPAAIRERMEDLAARRREKQPLEYPSAGSTFKRPEGYFAGKLIEEAGLKGYRQGGAQVSEKHCGFVINRDGATAADIREICRVIRRRVWETSGVMLETEVKMLGFEEA